MKAILNIGLARNGSVDLNVGEVLLAVKSRLVVKSWEQVISNTEATIVAEVEGPVLSSTYAIARRLGQDCIAVWQPNTEVGRLIGPNAAAWGEFNLEFFLLLDGSILSTTVAHA